MNILKYSKVFFNHIKSIRFKGFLSNIFIQKRMIIVIE